MALRHSAAWFQINFSKTFSQVRHLNSQTWLSDTGIFQNQPLQFPAPSGSLTSADLVSVLSWHSHMNDFKIVPILI